MTCSKEDDRFGCMEKAYQLHCQKPITGPGITLGKMSTEIDWLDPAIPPVSTPCVIQSVVYENQEEKNWPINNAPEISIPVTPPKGWVKVITVACPHPDVSESCGTLIEKGCTAIDTPRCVAWDSDGSCTRFEATYRCEEKIEGDDIIQNPPIEKPTGGLVIDERACEEKRQEAQDAGLTCIEKEKKCIQAGETIVIDGITYENPCALWEKTYTCTGTTQRGCKALEKLKRENYCRRIEKITCVAWDQSGKCVRARGSFSCVAPFNAENPPDPTNRLLGTERVAVMSPSNETAPQGCTLEKVEKLDQGGWRIVNGRWAWRDLWTEKRTYLCSQKDRRSCESLAQDTLCQLDSQRCIQEKDDGSCDRYRRTYTCTRPDEVIDVGEVCDGKVCIGNLCQRTDDQADDDFGHAAVQLEIGRQLGLYGDLQNNRFFSGETLVCKDRKGAPSCCRREVVPAMSNAGFSTFFLWGGVTAATETIRYLGSPYVYDLLAYSPKTEPLLNALYGSASNGVYNPTFSYWGVTVESTSAGWEFRFSPESFALAAALHFYEVYRSCSIERQKLAMARGQGLCHFVGERCDKESALGCLKREEVYVCFNSRLARIINEGGRSQIGRGWGTPTHPDPLGFTIEELQALDFSKIPLEEFIQEIVHEALVGKDAIDDIDLQAAITKRIERILAGHRAHYRPTPPPNGTTNQRQSSTYPFSPAIAWPPKWS